MALLGNELLRGEMVYLNRITRDDLPHLVAHFQDVYYLRHLQRRSAMPFAPEDMEGWYKHTLEHEDEPTFAIRTLVEDELLGMCGFKDIRWAARHSYFWIGIGNPAKRGQGYGTDATRVLLKYAFMELNLNCVGLEVFGYNEPAMKSYTKIGFQYDGKARAYLYRDGDYYDMHLMSMLRSEWDARYGGKRDE